MIPRGGGGRGRGTRREPAPPAAQKSVPGRPQTGGYNLRPFTRWNSEQQQDVEVCDNTAPNHLREHGDGSSPGRRVRAGRGLRALHAVHRHAQCRRQAVERGRGAERVPPSSRRRRRPEREGAAARGGRSVPWGGGAAGFGAEAAAVGSLPLYLLSCGKGAAVCAACLRQRAGRVVELSPLWLV